MSTPRRHQPHEVALALVGCDFRVASASWRAALVLTPEERQALAARLASAAGLRALAVVDTCNRTEWVVEAPHPAWSAELLRSWMLRRWRAAAPGEALPEPYVKVGTDAVRHYVRVAVGLESFVAGEREIAGQCTKAMLLAREQGLSSPLLDELAKASGRAVRKLERLGRFRDATRGVHALGADHVQARLSELRPGGFCGARVAVAGIGVLGRKVASLLEVRGARVAQFNRTVRPGSLARPLGDLRASLHGFDALVACTGALGAAIRLPDLSGRDRPLLVLDLGVPPQVDADASADGIELAGLDDILSPAAAGAPEAQDIELATEIAEAAVTEVLLADARRTSAEMIRAAQAKRDELRDERLPTILDEHAGGLDPAHRKRLETALRALMTEQHRALIEEVERHAAGLLAAAASHAEESDGAGPPAARIEVERAGGAGGAS